MGVIGHKKIQINEVKTNVQRGEIFDFTTFTVLARTAHPLTCLIELDNNFIKVKNKKEDSEFHSIPYKKIAGEADGENKDLWVVSKSEKDVHNIQILTKINRNIDFISNP